MSSSSQNRNNVQEVGTPPRVKQLLRTSLTAVYSCAEQSHKDSVRKATVEDQFSSKTVHPAMRAQLHLLSLHLSCSRQWPREQHSYACMIMNS